MKYLIGRVMKTRVSLFFLFFFFSLNSYSDISVPLPGVPLKNPNIVEDLKVRKAPFVPESIEESSLPKTDKKSIYVTDQEYSQDLGKDITTAEMLRSYGVTIPHSMEGGTSYERMSNRDLLKTFNNEGTRGFSFYYIRDEYDFFDSSGIYDRTFGKTASRSVQGGSLHFSLERYWSHKSIWIGWSMNFGVGLAQGKGSFTNSAGTVVEKSETTFSLWTLPVDLGLLVEIPLGSWLKIGLSGGPSLMGLYQHRNDKDNGESGKRVRQVSYGYFGKANLKISLSHLSPKLAVRNLKSYQMTKTYLTLEARIQSFENFQDEDVSITGSSFGIGFAFEYL
ncbi:MAG: hypothetical protein ACJAT2_003705 [Bacteriovoracaceae bacterium]|jgi:hypothetical protein